MGIDLKGLTIAKTQQHFTRGDFSAKELADAYCKVIEEKNREVNAYLEVFDDVAEQAKNADAKLKKREGGALTGIPLAIKDNILIKGRRVSAASKILEGYRARYDASAIVRLKNEGALFLGRTNMDEFAMGGSTGNSAYGVTKNPYDMSRVAGGSSGGSAAAVAGDMALAALGSDTGGSVRQPASFCGLVGLKPTYGRVSRFGLMAMGSSLDQIGTFGKTVEDAEILFNAIKGVDSLDSTSEAFSDSVSLSKKMVIGIPRHFMESGIDEDVRANFEHTLELLKAEGCVIKDVTLPHIGYSLAAYYIIMPAEVSSNLARFDGVKYGLYKEGAHGIDDYFETRGNGFGKEVRRRIMLGTYVLSAGYYDAYYNQATTVRRMVMNDFAEAFSAQEVDAVLTPTSPVPAFTIGEKSSDPLSMYLADIFTVTANIVGIPALSVPSGSVVRNGNKLPLGVQLMSNYGREDILFFCGKMIENAQN